MPSESIFEQQRQTMVIEQLRGRGIRQKAILNAFLQVPREEFVPLELRDHAYEDRALPIGHRQTISQPFVVAWMLALLNLKPTDRVLEIGSGSGYVLALLSHIVREAFGVERIEVLATAAQERLARLELANVKIKFGDGNDGWIEYQPFEKILVSAGGQEIPERLKSQLAVGGRMILPIGDEPRNQKLVQVDHLQDGSYKVKRLGRVSFVPLLSGTRQT
ncbi:MAG: protein-L-isoaspartate(D-aspartate) O-methyltransferase [Ardenticatenaceae bacterium]|nr:protein-L-isoaspartate(D-aspartate) O-methyltransferase [Ardenticatenaceae bacterium]